MIYAIAALFFWCLTLTFVLYGVARPPKTNGDPLIHLDAALGTVRALADHIDVVEGKLLELGTIKKRTDVSQTARAFVERIAANVEAK